MADATVMTEDAETGLIVISAGLSCMIAIQYIRQIVSPERALKMIITGRFLEEEEAERIGLVTRAVSGENVFETAIEVAGESANESNLAVAFTKSANAVVGDMHINGATEYLNEHFTLLAGGEGCA